MWSSTPDALRVALGEAEELSTEQLEVEIRVLKFFIVFFMGKCRGESCLGLDDLGDLFFLLVFWGVLKGRMIFLLFRVWLGCGNPMCIPRYVIFWIMYLICTYTWNVISILRRSSAFQATHEQLLSFQSTSNRDGWYVVHQARWNPSFIGSWMFIICDGSGHGWHGCKSQKLLCAL